MGRDRNNAGRDEIETGLYETRQIRDFRPLKTSNSRQFETRKSRDETRRDGVSRLVSPRISRLKISRPIPRKKWWGKGSGEKVGGEKFFRGKILGGKQLLGKHLGGETS